MTGEYLGVLLLVAVIVAAVVASGIGRTVADGVSCAVANVSIAGGDACGSDDTAGPSDGGDDGDDGDDGGRPPGGQDGDPSADDGRRSIEDEAEEMAEDLLEEMENTPGFFEVNSFGECLSASGAFGGGATVQGCLVYDGDRIAILGGGGVGVGTPSAGAMAGPIISNAESVDQLTGESLCVGGSMTSHIFVGGGGDVCFGLDENGFTGIWSLAGGVTAGTPGPEGHIYYTETTVLAEIDVPDIPSLEEVEEWLVDAGMSVAEAAEVARDTLGDAASQGRDMIEDGIDAGRDAACRNFGICL